MTSAKASFRAGVRDTLPAVPANVPFGVIVGVTAVGVGISPLQTFAMSVFVFAGAAQVAAIDLLGNDAPAVVVLATALVVNLRYMMYSASIATYFRRLRTRWKLPLSYFLLDVDYAISITKFRQDDDVNRPWYFLGSALPLWVAWVGSTVLGIVLGARVPESWGLDFAIPLLFLALLVPALEGRATYLAAAVGGVVAVAGAGLPFDVGLLVGAVAGVAAGIVAEGRVG